MKFTYSWLLDHLETEKTEEEISEQLTNLGLEVENIKKPDINLKSFMVVEVVNVEKHPNADRLTICKVNNGKEILDVVCGAKNVRKGMKSIYAPIGSFIPESDIILRKKEIRGVESNGMLCSERELLISEDHDGIIEVPESFSIGISYIEYAGLDDVVFDVALTPNRGDCASVRGLARDLAASGIGRLKNFSIKHIEEKFDSSIEWKLCFKQKKFACSRVVGRYFKNVNNADSPLWIQRRLKSIGLRPISGLVDITNYLTYDIGRPLHVFDAKKIKGNVCIRFAKTNENILALDDREYLLQNTDIIIADDSGPVGLAGIIGGKNTGVDQFTTDVFLEVAHFNPKYIAATARRLAITSDASYRFERGVDYESTNWGTDIASNYIIDICGGSASKIASASIETPVLKPIKYYPEKVMELTSLQTSPIEQKKILLKLGFHIDEIKNFWIVVVPSWRFDVTSAEDLVEEVARIVGYNKIPTLSLPIGKSLEIKSKSMISDNTKTKVFQSTLSLMGYNEIVTFSFLNSAKSKLFGGNDNLILDNPISNELDCLRPTLLINLIEVASKNFFKGNADTSFLKLAMFILRKTVFRRR